MVDKQEFWEALTLRREVDKTGTIRWYNSDRELHRDNGPAVEYPDGERQWYQNGKRHRDNGPAVILQNGTKYWYQNGKLHRDNDLPAVEYVCLDSSGKLHRDEINGNRTKEWYQNGKRHRDNGPAVILQNGAKYWYRHGKLHRENDLPAVEYVCLNHPFDSSGKLHRENEINGNRTKEWYQNGV